MIGRGLALGCALALLGACSGMGAAGAETAAAEAERVPLEIRTKTGRHRFRVEVARTPEAQMRGLMFRTSLPRDGGMIFPFAEPREASFWMKNTPLPLDLIFIRADGTIAHIAENAVPFSEAFVTSDGEIVSAVLELEGGRTSELGIAEGDRVIWQDTTR